MMEKIPDIIHPSWHQYLQPLFDDQKMNMIKNDLLPNCKYYPAGEDIFRVFSMPIDEIKVVILGQDPYFNGEANGFAFAVTQKTKIPASLSIIKNEITNSNVNRVEIQISEWKTLWHWIAQGVFLLNSALTVEAGVAGSHAGQWNWFIREVIRIISFYTGGQAFSNCKPVWLLWGAKAKAFKSYIANPWKYERDKSWDNYKLDTDSIREANVYLEADHPAAETYPGSKYKFTGCNHFNLCNEILKKKGQKIINW